MEDIARKLHPLERKVMPFLDKCSTASELVEKTGLQEVEVVRALQWLSNKELVKLDKKQEEIVSLEKNGLEYKEKGLPEMRLLKSLEREKELELMDIKGKTGLTHEELTASMGRLKKQGLVEIESAAEELFIRITQNGMKRLFHKTVEETFLERRFPVTISELDAKERYILERFRKRKEIVSVERKTILHYDVTAAGKKLLDTGIIEGDYIEKVTPETIKGLKWKKKDFRAYDVTINVPKINYGKKHFVNEAIEYARRMWLDMGFREMTGSMVHTAFWDLDTLFVPQDHPARQMQDTFYLASPEKGKMAQKEIYEKVKKTHEDGWTTGSKGWQYKFNEETAKRLLLRTHTTVLSAETLSRLKKDDLPAKFFSVGKVFRNESLDWKHLFEFHQVEGIVVDPNANFRHLIGYLKEFFAKMGFPDVRVRPGYFPYTEPSAEVDVYDPRRKQWVELGGSGIFRPEVTKPLLGFECPVLAWGLGLERIITDFYGISDLRQIYQNDLKQLRRMKKFNR